VLIVWRLSLFFGSLNVAFLVLASPPHYFNLLFIISTYLSSIIQCLLQISDHEIQCFERAAFDAEFAPGHATHWFFQYANTNELGLASRSSTGSRRSLIY
jgi:hypothetical protein